ncbi:hypothetical protein [Paraburkholderia sp. BCC1884]|nr:hypothetical protein [Paraburkholderia sp. BCC1884]
MQKTAIRRLVSSGKGAGWFVLLWLSGVAGTALLVLPFHVLIALAMRH